MRRRIAPLPLEEQYRQETANAAQRWPILFLSTIARRCIDRMGAHRVRAAENHTMRPTNKRTARARENHILGVLSNARAILRNNWRPYHRTNETRQNVAFRHNPLPIDSSVFRWTIGGMTIADHIKDADPPGGNHHHCLTYKEC